MAAGFDYQGYVDGLSERQLKDVKEFGPNVGPDVDRKTVMVLADRRLAKMRGSAPTTPVTNGMGAPTTAGPSPAAQARNAANNAHVQGVMDGSIGANSTTAQAKAAQRRAEWIAGGGQPSDGRRGAMQPGGLLDNSRLSLGGAPPPAERPSTPPAPAPAPGGPPVAGPQPTPNPGPMVGAPDAPRGSMGQPLPGGSYYQGSSNYTQPQHHSLTYQGATQGMPRYGQQTSPAEQPPMTPPAGGQSLAAQLETTVREIPEFQQLQNLVQSLRGSPPTPREQQQIERLAAAIRGSQDYQQLESLLAEASGGLLRQPA